MPHRRATAKATGPAGEQDGGLDAPAPPQPEPAKAPGGPRRRLKDLRKSPARAGGADAGPDAPAPPQPEPARAGGTRGPRRPRGSSAPGGMRGLRRPRGSSAPGGTRGHKLKDLYDRLPHRRVSRPPSPPGDPATQQLATAGEQPTQPLAVGAAPAGGAQPPLRNRGRLRRRMRYLRRVRELQRRDLGGLVFELHRLGRRRDDLVSTKLGRLDATERELHALEALLGAGAQVEELREPGIGGTCPSCGELHGSSDRFCAACGVPLIGLPSPPRKA